MIPSEERRFNLREYNCLFDPSVVEFLMTVRQECWYHGGIHYRAWHMIAEVASDGWSMAEIHAMNDREWIWRPNCGPKTFAVIKALLEIEVKKSPASIMMDCETV